MKYFPNNTVTRYSTHLQSTVNLDGNWEAALVEISLPRTWMTITSNAGNFTVTGDYEEESGRMSPYSLSMQISPGYYKTVKEIVDELNGTITKMMFQKDWVNKPDETYWPKFKFYQSKRKVAIQLSPHGSIRFDDHLSNILGFPANEDIVNHGNAVNVIVAERTCNLNTGVQSVYVYCDVLENVPVGDTQAPLLRIVETSSIHGDIVHVNFDPPRYIPVQKMEFDALEIDIRDEYGQPVSFESGQSVVTLHFRRASSSYFL